MRFRLAVVGVLIAITGFSVWIWEQHHSKDAMDLEFQFKMMRKMAKGTKDDPDAREKWELKRLRDPRTGKIPTGIRATELSFARNLPRKEDLFLSPLMKGNNEQLLTWSRRGPFNVGGRTRALGIDVRTTSPPNVTIIAGGVSGGLWKSTNDGTTWVQTSNLSQVQNITCLAQDVRSGSEDTWYAGSGERYGSIGTGGGQPYQGNGIYKSTDNGSSWTLLSFTASNTPATFDDEFDFVHNVAVSPVTGVVYAAASNIVTRSTNGGTTWGVVRGVLANNSLTDVQVASDGVIYAALNSSVTDAGIWRSTNDGASWALINSGVAGFPSSHNRIDITISPSNPDVVYFLVQQIDTTTTASQIRGHQLWKYSYVSGDGTGAGGTWENRGGNLPLEAGKDGNARFDTQGGYDIHMVVRPNDENFIILGGINLYRSTDAFATASGVRIGGYAVPTEYTQYDFPDHHPDQHSGMFLPGSNTVFYSGHDGGVSKTDDITQTTVNWNSLNKGYYTTQFYTVAIDHGTPSNVIIGGMQDNGTWWTNSTGATVPWVDVYSGDGAHCAITDGLGFYYASSQLGNTLRFELDGADGSLITWSNVTPSGASGFQFINPLVIDPNDNNVMFMAGGDRVWRNSDLTAIADFNPDPTTTNWSSFNSATVSGEEIVSLAISRSPSNILYFGTDIGSVYKIADASNTSSSKTDVTGAGFPSGFVSSIALHPNNADSVMAVFSNYAVESIFMSTNGGTTWTAVGGNLEAVGGPSVRSATIVPTSQGVNYFVATSTGVYSTSTLNGASTIWALEGSSVIGNVVVDMVDSRASDGLVVAATHGNGVFSSNIVVSATTPEPAVPMEYGISQNYPNPFNPSTTISYTLPKQSRVKITVYDIGGREISVLVNKTMSAGPQSVVWNATDLRGAGVPSGVYFYTIRATPFDGGEPFAKTEKMTYVK